MRFPVSRAGSVSLFPRVMFLLVLSVFAGSFPSPTQASHAGHAQKAHLARLAAQEKAAWRVHLAKLRALPHAKRIAMKRHDRKFKKAEDHAHLARLAQQKAHEARLALLEKKARSHRARLAKAQSHAAAHQAKAARAVVAHHKTPTPHIAARPHAPVAHVSYSQAAHNARLAAHNARLANSQSNTLARLRAHQQALAQKALSRQARIAKSQAAHNARAAAQHAHWIALHGDGSGGRSIHFWQAIAAGVPVKIITVDLNDRDVKVSAVMARRGNGTAEPFRQMIERANPNVAVTGTFFSLDNLRPIGDIVIDGSLIHFGGMGTALCITPSNRADMVTTEWGRHHDWSGYDFVCACGPRLLRRGRVVLDPASERFRDRHMLAPNSRIAVGITRGNKIVFVMTHEPIYLGRLAKVMQAVGVSEAMNLDAGTSTGFYYNGATLARPGRQLTNMIVVYGQKERYERALDQLVPAAYRRSDTRLNTRHQVSLAAVR